MMIPCLWSLLFGFDALTGVGWKGAPAAASFLVDIPRGLGNGIWRKRPYGLRLRIFPQPLGGALKNPNAAPTTPPCFSRRLRSSLLHWADCLRRYAPPPCSSPFHCTNKKEKPAHNVYWFFLVRWKGLEPPAY